jgi:hypothetical protein
MSNEFERMWKGEVVAWFNVHSLDLPGGNEDNHGKLQSGYPVSGPEIWSRDLPETKRDC